MMISKPYLYFGDLSLKEMAKGRKVRIDGGDPDGYERNTVFTVESFSPIEPTISTPPKNLPSILSVLTKPSYQLIGKADGGGEINLLAHYDASDSEKMTPGLSYVA